MADDYQAKLKSLLDKAISPLETVAMEVKVNGIFSLPEAWVKQV